MKNHRDFFQALLDGDTLIDSFQGVEISMDDVGVVRVVDGNAILTSLLRFESFEIKPVTIQIGKKIFNPPAPYRTAPPEETEYFALDGEEGVSEYTWQCDATDNKMLMSGLAFKTREDAELAVTIRQDIFAALMKDAK